MKIIIAGAKSSGKTTTGNALAARLNIPFVDLDDIIIDQCSKDGTKFSSCAEIYRALGKEKFRALERDAVGQAARYEGCVISTGGSTLLNSDSRRRLRQNAIWIYLKASMEFLWQRLRSKSLPAYLEKESDPQKAFSERIERIDEVLSCHCDFQTNVDNASVDDVVGEILQELSFEYSVRASSPNTLGEIVRLTTFGESHGPMIGAVLDGVQPGLAISAEEIQQQLDRRKPGQNAVSTQRKESDKVQIVSGVFEGKTTGAPIGLIIPNADSRSSSYDNIKDIFRPGHADYTFWQKYGIRDYRGGGRSSGRETACRVAGGAIARKILLEKGVKITAYTAQIGDVAADNIDYDEIEKNPVRCPDAEAAEKMEHLILAKRKADDSVGGIVKVEITGLPAGLGDPVFAKLDSKLAAAFFSIGAVKGVEFGAGFGCACLTGKQNNDQMKDGKFLSNNAGGILGGISTGEKIKAAIAVKPTPSITAEQKTCDIKGENEDIRIEGRHDPCILPRVIAVVESMAALTVLDVWRIQQRIRPQRSEN